jgi:DNA-binding transcriptional LysR family regulator
MNLRSVDLNLLVALEALLRERHVTRAADRIGLSQPAMSNALGRLRHIFGDDLLVRTAKGMQPTPRAEQLLPQTQQLLKQIERVLEDDGSFQAKASKRKFSLRMSDLLSMLLLPNLLDNLRTSAPAVGLDIVHLSPARTVDALERDEIDLAVSMGLEHSHAISSRVLFSDSMVCLMSRKHALARKTLTLENLLAYRHLKVSMSPTDLRFVDDVLSRKRLARDVALNVPHWLVVPHVLARTDHLAVMSGRFARKIAGSTLVIKDLPFAPEPFDWSVYWHRRHETNQAIVWLRKLIFDTAARS